MTAPELAERFEVSRRTINRDIENLCKAGIPISTTQGVGGGIRIHYYAPNGESTREIEPHFLIFKWSSWYVWGWCRLREDFRMFKLTRMDQIEYTDRENLITWMLMCKDQVKVIEPEDVREDFSALPTVLQRTIRCKRSFRKIVLGRIGNICQDQQIKKI